MLINRYAEQTVYRGHTAVYEHKNQAYKKQFKLNRKVEKSAAANASALKNRELLPSKRLDDFKYETQR